eukprot:8658181-Ditylum_brightwellii.AAC.1
MLTGDKAPAPKCTRRQTLKANDQSGEDKHDEISGTDAYELITEEAADTSSSSMQRQNTEPNIDSGQNKSV